MYGLIEWGGDLLPTLIVGTTSERLHHAAFRILAHSDPINDDVRAYIAGAPPSGVEGDVAVRAWLAGLWAVTPTPSFIEFDVIDVIEAG